MPDLVIHNKIEELEKLAEFVSGFSTRNGLSDKEYFELNLVLDELITNIIMHGFNDNALHNIEVQIEMDSGVVLMKVTDDGNEFNPLTHERKDQNLSLQDKPIGGLGIFFVKEKTDEITYSRENSKNILTLKKTMKKDRESNDN